MNDWRPRLWIGAKAPGGLALPDAHPSPSTCYGPRGVYLDENHLVVADTGNHRIMIWHGWPDADHAACDVVLGQPDAIGEGPAAGGRGPEHGLHLPTGVIIHDGRLVVADAWHHRILIWNSVPTRGDARPDLVLGQPDLTSVEPNRGKDCDASTLYWPFGISVVNGQFYVADTGNRRVLGFTGGIPEDPDTPADLVLGQDDPRGREENRGGPANARSFRWPHDIAGTDQALFIADAGNHRVLGWSPHPDRDQDATLLHGQSSFADSAEFPYAPQSSLTLRFPYAVGVTPTAGADESQVAIADTANNRVLLWPYLSFLAGGEPTAVLGQPSFSANGENRWRAVEADTLCWPYGLCLSGRRIAVADSGNNRVIIWERT